MTLSAKLDLLPVSTISDKRHELQLQRWILTISCHGSHIGPIHDTLVFLSQSLDVAFAEVQDLLPQHSAVLVTGSLLDSKM